MNQAKSPTMLHEVLQERVLEKLRFATRPPPTMEGLCALYASWCHSVPFDNVRKLIHVKSGDSGALPGGSADDFFEAWLKHGTGGTCWAGAGALCALLKSLGFEADRGVATMLVVPDLPPNHGTVRVTFDATAYLVDSSILHGLPLRLDSESETSVEHPAWGVRCSRRDGRWHVAWRPLHKPDGFECRFERFGAMESEYQAFYEQTRGWSPFNYEVTARINRGNRVVGVGFGKGVTLESDGSVNEAPVTQEERVRVLIEDIGLSEEIVEQLPRDTPTPPPPGSRTATFTSE